MKRCKWAVFISGQGTNLQALLDAQPPIDIELVVSNKPEAPGVRRAERAGVPVHILPKEVDWSELSLKLKDKKIDFLFLLGFMKIVPERFIQEWSQKILNLHPSLLPNYKGLKAIERSFEEGAAMGVTIHWVTPDLDAGPILLQEKVFEAQSFEVRSKALSLEEARRRLQMCENKLVVEAVRRCEAC